MTSPKFTQLPPLSLYIHIPWCVRKCPYCDFNSHAVGTNSYAAGTGSSPPEQDYIKALLADLDRDLDYAQNRPLQSIFFGGGTPSLFSSASIDAILTGVRQRLAFCDDIEITLEANPGTFEQEKFAGFREAGVNRLSIGVQSFNNRHLKRLGRIHSSDEAQHAITQARNSGFNNINLDLMHGLPGQTLEEAMTDLDIAMALKPEHLSWYQLTLEPNTEFYKHPPNLPDPDTLWEIYQKGQALLAQRAYSQYEVSAYCQYGREAQHNLNYWRFGDYLGIGAGAHGKITRLKDQSILRTRKTRLPKDYLKQDQGGLTEIIPSDAIAGEFMMNALRLNQGFASDLFERATGLPLADLELSLQQAQTDGLLECTDSIRATANGRLFLNDLIAYFI